MTGFQKNVLNLLRSHFEIEPDDWLSTEEIATRLNKKPQQLYNPNTDKGPLYYLWKQGYIHRLTLSTGNYEWVAIGAEIIWR